ncbi:MAG: addiction module protein [Ignavibacteriaceae bacterium]|nr:addiction module protein [Ignavibacteriaceae bacterium]
MSNLAEKFIEEALMLPLEDRAELVDKLLQSLNVPTQSDVDRLWMDEVEKRINEYDSKKVESLNGENVIREIRSKLKK